MLIAKGFFINLFILINYRCNTILCKPTGGKAKLTVGCAFKVKNWLKKKNYAKNSRFQNFNKIIKYFVFIWNLLKLNK